MMACVCVPSVKLKCSFFSASSLVEGGTGEEINQENKASVSGK